MWTIKLKEGSSHSDGHTLIEVIYMATAIHYLEIPILEHRIRTNERIVQQINLVGTISRNTKVKAHYSDI